MHSEDAAAAIARSAAAWPGSLAQLATELGWSDSKLRAWAGCYENGWQRAPREEDAAAVRAAVARLLHRALAELADPSLPVTQWTRRGTPPGARHGNAVPKKDRKNAAATATPDEST